MNKRYALPRIITEDTVFKFKLTLLPCFCNMWLYFPPFNLTSFTIFIFLLWWYHRPFCKVLWELKIVLLLRPLLKHFNKAYIVHQRNSGSKFPLFGDWNITTRARFLFSPKMDTLQRWYRKKAHIRFHYVFCFSVCYGHGAARRTKFFIPQVPGSTGSSPGAFEPLLQHGNSNVSMRNLRNDPICSRSGGRVCELHPLRGKMRDSADLINAHKKKVW